MRGTEYPIFRKAVSCVSVGLLMSTSFAFGQNSEAPPADAAQQQSANPSGGWPRVSDMPQAGQSAAPADQNQNNPAGDAQAPPPPVNDNGYGQQPYPNQPYPNQPANGQPAYPPPPMNGQPAYNPQGYPQGPIQPGYGTQQGYPQAPNQPAYGQPGYNQPAYNNQQYPAPPPVPAQLTIPAGTFITARVNQMLSSDKNQPGDAFSATLVEPVVVNGVVVAEPGETIGGRVVTAQKAGRVEGVAKLGIQLTNLSLVDGQQVPIQTQLVSRRGPTSTGQDAGVIMGTTALGAAVGAAAAWGTGAAWGAGAGLAAGLIGVLVTRGHPSIIYPEQVLTFRLEAPVTVSTQIAPQAFRYVQPGEYDQPAYGPGPSYAPGPQYVAAAPAPYYGYPYPYYGYYPYYWGPYVSFYWGPGFWWGGRWYGGWGRGYVGRGYVGRGFVGGRVGGVAVGHVGGVSGGHVAGGGGRR